MTHTGQLAGLTEIALLLHVSKRTASRYVSRGDFPEPLDRLASGPVWASDDIREWAAANLPLVMGWRKGRKRRSPAS